MAWETGGTIVAALEMLKDRGVDFKQIKVVSRSVGLYQNDSH